MPHKFFSESALSVGLGIAELVGEDNVDACVMLMKELRFVAVLLRVELEMIELLLSRRCPMKNIDVRRLALIESEDELTTSETCV